MNAQAWKKCVDFHGHACGGLAIGYRAAQYAMELLGAGPSEDEDIVCVSENDACGIDAIQALLGCSAGKGNLIFRLRGKQAFSFFDRTSGKSVRLVLKPREPEGDKAKRLEYMLSADAKELFDVKTPSYGVPEKARLFQSLACDCCGESTADYWLRLADGKRLCLDCFKEYER